MRASTVPMQDTPTSVLLEEKLLRTMSETTFMSIARASSDMGVTVGLGSRDEQTLGIASWFHCSCSVEPLPA